MRRTVLIATAIIAFVLLGVGSASGATVSCGQTITESTTVDNDLANCPSYGLIIGADDITLDLNGHTIDGVSFDGFISSLVGIDGHGHSGLTVENGTVQEFDLAVLLTGGNNVLRDVTATGGESAGVFLGFADHNRIDHVRASGAFSWAIYLADSTDNTITDSSTFGNDGDIGIGYGSDRNVIERSSLANGGIRINSNGNLVTKSSLSGGPDAGIGVFPGALDNVIEKSSVSGFSLGIGAAGTTRLEDNEVFDNRGDGFRVDTSGVVLVKNRAHGNRGDGIDVLAAGATVTKNTANANGDLGIEAVAGTIDGGGNKASGNGNPAQCTGVSCK